MNKKLEDIAQDNYELTGMTVGPLFPRLYNMYCCFSNCTQHISTYVKKLLKNPKYP